jgi:hypothetical protein
MTEICLKIVEKMMQFFSRRREQCSSIYKTGKAIVLKKLAARKLRRMKDPLSEKKGTE